VSETKLCDGRNVRILFLGFAFSLLFKLNVLTERVGRPIFRLRFFGRGTANVRSHLFSRKPLISVKERIRGGIFRSVLLLFLVFSVDLSGVRTGILVFLAKSFEGGVSGGYIRSFVKVNVFSANQRERHRR